MDCSEVKQIVRILLIQEGTNPPPELGEHLRECRACAARFAPLLAIAAKVQHLPEKELPAGFDTRFKDRLVQRMQQEGSKGARSAFLSVAATDEFRWVLVLVLSVGPVAAALGDALAAAPQPSVVSASNTGFVALGLLFAAAFVQAVLHWDAIIQIFRRRMV